MMQARPRLVGIHASRRHPLIFIAHRQLAHVLVSLHLPIGQETRKLGDLVRAQPNEILTMPTRHIFQPTLLSNQLSSDDRQRRTTPDAEPQASQATRQARDTASWRHPAIMS